MFYKVITGKSCFPLPQLLSGTFTSSGTQVTLYNTTEAIKVGDYLYSATLNEIKKVLSFPTEGNANSNRAVPEKTTLIIIESAFSSDIVVKEALRITERKIFTDVSVAVINTVDALFNGETFPKRTVLDIEDENIHFTVNGTGTAVSILATP